MSDLISRQAAIDVVSKACLELRGVFGRCEDALNALPSAQPDLDEWCTDCKEYDQERHCCPRWNRVIRQALKDAQPTQRWIPCSERLPEDFGEYLVTKKAIGWNCEEYNSNDIAYFDNEGFHKADKVLAWMPLPETYQGEGEE